MPLRFVFAILVRPFSTWRTLAIERFSIVALLLGYVAPLSLILPVATFVARRYVGFRTGNVVYRASVDEALGQATYGFVLAVAGLVLVTAIVYLLAPLFGARRSFVRSLRVAAFAHTPVWLAAVVVLVPAVGLIELFALAYEIFLLHAGLSVVMEIPRGKAGALAACAVVGAVAIAVGFGVLSALVVGGGVDAL